MDTGDILLGGNPALPSTPFRGGVAIFSVASCYRNRDKLWPCEPPWLVCDFPFTYPTLSYTFYIYSVTAEFLLFPVVGKSIFMLCCSLSVI